MARFRLTLALAGLALLPACRKAPPPQSAAAAEAAKAGSSLDLNGFHARASHLGALVWEAEAAQARVFRAEQRARGTDVTMTYFSHGRKVSVARADHADLNLQDYDMDAQGHVVVRGTNGVLLETEKLHWDNTQQRATSQSRVRLTRGGTVLTGLGFSADKDMHDVRVLADVQAEAASVQGLREDAKTWKNQP
ncbi:MAG TPA: LPS export ABC transporter periplasmic protein LptC [bacterium]|nr:LPS export ABC transporter periplasmic protein LptC [bacterium]